MTGRGRGDSDRASAGEGRSVRVRVADKRHASSAEERDASSDATTSDFGEDEARPEIDPSEVEKLRGQVDGLTDDLKRLQAEFDNYRKRMMRDQSEVGRQVTARFAKKLLPVLDNFDRALSHGADENIEMLRGELMKVLAAEGIEEIPAQDSPFDPHVHEAVESREVADLNEPTVLDVYRRGYRLGSKVLRPAMVAVSRPTETQHVDETGEPSPSDVAAGEH